MPLAILTELVDLNICPTLVATLHPGDQLTIGDLHGNAVKLIYFLIKQGILQFKQGIADYQKIIEIYNKNALTQELTLQDLAEFNNILKQATVPENASQALIRLIGDEVADRGNNDYFTLLVLKKLKENNIPTEIILSNHGAEFVRYYEDPKCQIQINDKQISSLWGLQALIENNLVTSEEVQQLVNTAYKPSIKLLSYLVDSTTEPHTITLYSHAPIDRKMINNLVTYFNKELPATEQHIYSDLTVEGLTNAIDFINKEFEKLVIANQVSDHLTAGQPISYAIWNRNVVNIDRTAKDSNNAYGIRYVHGHVGEQPDDANTPHIVNLDTNLGRPTLEEGKYLVEVAKVLPVLAPPQPLLPNTSPLQDIGKGWPHSRQPQITADPKIVQKVNWEHTFKKHQQFAFTASTEQDVIGSITSKELPNTGPLVNIMYSGKLELPLDEHQKLKSHQPAAILAVLQALLTESAATFTDPLTVKANNFTEEHLHVILDTLLKDQNTPVYFIVGEEASTNIKELINGYNTALFRTTPTTQNSPDSPASDSGQKNAL